MTKICLNTHENTSHMYVWLFKAAIIMRMCTHLTMIINGTKQLHQYHAFACDDDVHHLSVAHLQVYTMRKLCAERLYLNRFVNFIMTQAIETVTLPHNKVQEDLK